MAPFDTNAIQAYLRNSSAAALTDFKFAKLSCKKNASFPVLFLSSRMAASPLALSRQAM
jgi:hypothetical protein